MRISNLIVALSLVLWSVSVAAQDGSGDGPADAAPAATQEGSGEAPAASDEAAPEAGSGDVSAEEAEASEPASEPAAETRDEGAPTAAGQLPEGVDAGIQIDGMVCQFCASGIERLMSREDRVDTFEVSFDDSIVYVTFVEGETMSDQQLARIIRRSGYDSRGVIRN